MEPSRSGLIPGSPAASRSGPSEGPPASPALCPLIRAPAIMPPMLGGRVRSSVWWEQCPRQGTSPLSPGARWGSALPLKPLLATPGREDVAQTLDVTHNGRFFTLGVPGAAGSFMRRGCGEHRPRPREPWDRLRATDPSGLLNCGVPVVCQVRDWPIPRPLLPRSQAGLSRCVPEGAHGHLPGALGNRPRERLRPLGVGSTQGPARLHPPSVPDEGPPSRCL